ncbi:MAG TPA: glycosyltransferase family 4 protein [Ignavibacteriaceae bacterium]|nr:glycosyltransferase family 4 protein [Ignavibacteriaceae bacterium]
MTKVLIVVNELLNTCGISKHLLYFLNEMQVQREFEFSILCGGGDAINAYKNLCKEIIVNEKIKHENRSYLNYFISIVNVVSLIKKNNYKIIHSHTHYTANMSHLACKFTKATDIQTIHGVIPEIGKLNHFAGSFIICVNEHVLDYIKENNFKQEKKIKLIHCGIKSINTSLKANDNTLRILAASRIVPEKGLDVFIKAIAMLPISVREKAEFIIAGKGPYEKEIKKINNELGTKVKFIGEVSDLTEILKTTHIFVLPTVSDSEGLPLTLIEAALTKNLIISSRYRGISPVFSETLESLLFEKGNIQELADKIQHSIKNYSKYQNTIDSIFDKVSKEFSINKMINEITNLYNDTAL